MQIFHNPRCTKSRQMLQLLKDKNIEVEVIEYLKNPPSEKELKTILTKLDIPAEKLLRKKEAIFKENFSGKTLSEDDCIKAMLEYPRLIERPIVIKGDKAIIGRPTENINDLI